jgi:hypothetical protein
MPTSNNNRTAERLPPRPLATAERLQSRPLALNDNYLSSPLVHGNNNNYTPRVNSPHSHPPHHKGMRELSLSLHPYSGRDSDSYRLRTPTSANYNKTKSSSISSNHSNNHSYISNHYSNISNHNKNYNDSSITYITTSTISSPQSHHLHHQGYGGASSTNSSHSINYTEECVESILALSPLPILSKVPGLSDNQVRDLRHILPPEYMPGYFASNNNAFIPSMKLTKLSIPNVYGVL